MGGSSADPAADLLHASIALIMAKVKGLTACIVNISEKEAKVSERTNQLLTYIGGIKAWLNGLEGAVSESTRTHARRSMGGSRSISNKHPLLKVCRYAVLHATSAEIISL